MVGILTMVIIPPTLLVISTMLVVCAGYAYEVMTVDYNTCNVYDIDTNNVGDGYLLCCCMRCSCSHMLPSFIVTMPIVGRSVFLTRVVVALARMLSIMMVVVTMMQLILFMSVITLLALPVIMVFGYDDPEVWLSCHAHLYQCCS